MTPTEDQIVEYDFTSEEQEVIAEMLQNPILRNYLHSTFAQLREEYMSTLQYPKPGMTAAESAITAVHSIAGAAELHEQLLRLGTGA